MDEFSVITGVIVANNRISPDSALNGSLVHISNITKTYINGAGEFTALKDINLRFYQGEFIGVVGKSGSGKSTLVNMITGIDRPTGGKIFVKGLDIHALPEGKQARWRGLNLGVVFQFFQLLPMLTLLENVLLPMDFCNKYNESQRQDRAMDLLAMVGLENEANKLPDAVSGGQQQSAAIARALANDPPIIVADEPTGNLDARTADSVYDKFKALAAEGRTIIMITHDPEIEDHLSRKVLISDGEVIDPLLADVFPWLPHSVLRECAHNLVRKTYQPHEPIDVSSALSDHLILIEEGAIRITHESKPDSQAKITLVGGAFFSGLGVPEDPSLKAFSARAKSGPTTLGLLPLDGLVRRLHNPSEILNHLQGRLRQNLLGQSDPNGKNQG